MKGNNCPEFNGHRKSGVLKNVNYHRIKYILQLQV